MLSSLHPEQVRKGNIPEAAQNLTRETLEAYKVIAERALLKNPQSSTTQINQKARLEMIEIMLKRLPE